jgi:hypothetical protein
MDPALAALLKAGEILDQQAVPKGQRSAWMNRQTFLALGGTQEHWDSIEGDDEMKLIQA